MIKSGLLFLWCCSVFLSICWAYDGYDDEFDDEDPIPFLRPLPPPICPLSRPHRRLGMCYQRYEQPQAGLDDEGSLTIGHNFFIYGKGRSPRTYYGSHVSLLNVKAHIYSTTIEIKLLESSCRHNADEILKSITNQDEILLFKYNDTTIKLVDLVNTKQRFHMALEQEFNTDYPKSIRCQVKIKRVIDLRRFHQTTPQPEFPEHAHWLIFGHVKLSRGNSVFHLYMERLPLKCKDVHQLLEVTPDLGRDSRTPSFPLVGASVVLLRGVPGQATLTNGVPDDTIDLGRVYEAVSLEANPLTGQHRVFRVIVKRKVAVDVNLINIGCA